MRKIEKGLKRFDASLEWLLERIGMREEEIERIRQNGEIDETEKNQVLRTQRMKSIADVLEDVEALINTHFFDEFFKAKSSLFLKRITENQKLIDMRLFKGRGEHSTAPQKR